MILVHENNIIEFWNSVNGESSKRLYKYQLISIGGDSEEFHIKELIGKFDDVEDESIVKIKNGKKDKSFINYMYELEEYIIKTKEDLDFFYKASEETYDSECIWIGLFKKIYKDYKFPVPNLQYITIYRCSDKNKNGLSWSLMKEVAMCFSDYSDYSDIQEMTIRTDDKRILCYYDNFEQEVVMDLK